MSAKKSFKRETFYYLSSLFDETNNTGCSESILSGFKNKKLSGKKKRQLLEDVGSGSQTERSSIQILQSHGEISQEFLEKLIKYFQKGNINDPHILFSHLDDPRILPLLTEAAEKVSDDYFSNYAEILGIAGDRKALSLLTTKFDNLKISPQLFKKDKIWNETALLIESVCLAILKLDPINTEVANMLVKLTEHPCVFNREHVTREISHLHRRWSSSYKVLKIFRNRLEAMLKTKDDKIFVAALPYLRFNHPEKTLEVTQLNSYLIKIKYESSQMF